MKYNNTKSLPFGADYYKDSEGESLDQNKTTLEETNEKDKNQFFNKINSEGEKEFNNININKVVYPNETLNQPDEVKPNLAKYNNQNIDCLKAQLTIIRNKDSQELQKKDLLKMKELIKNIIEIERDNSYEQNNSLSDSAIIIKEIFDYLDEKQKISAKIKTLESIEKNEEVEEVDPVCGAALINSNKQLEQICYITKVKTPKKKKESNCMNDRILNKKRYNSNRENSAKKGRISNEEKNNGKKGKIDNDQRMDNQRRTLYRNCLRRINETIFILSGLDIKDKIFDAVINEEHLRNVDSIIIFLKKKIKDIFLESTPRHYNDENYIKNREKIEDLCKNCFDTEDGKTLSILFNMTFKSVLEDHYLADNKYIKKGVNEDNDGKYELKEFITFKEDYANKDEKFKNKLKKKALKLTHRQRRNEENQEN